MRLTYVLVVLIYLTGQHGVHCGLINAGLYNLKMVRHERCEDEGTGEVYMDLRLKKKSTHKTFLQGFAPVPFDFDDNVHGEMEFSKLGSRGWGLNAYKIKTNNFCVDLFEKVPTFFEFYFKAWGIKNPSCPIKAGNYTVDLDTDLPRLAKLPMLPYGTYRLTNTITYGDPPIRVGCSEWYITCSERPSS